MDPSSINWLAVVVATASTFVIGAIWYGPIFGKAWMEEIGFTEEDLKEANMAKIYGLAFVLEFIMAMNLAFFIQGLGVGEGAFYGFLTGFGWIALAMGVNSLFSRSTFRLWFINSFYFVVSFTIMGVILAAWQ
ncbi:MAG: DUF1761 domain-containing protein [Cyclobacteriaceae bacterium]